MAIHVAFRGFANACLVAAGLAVSACTTPHFWWTYQNDLGHTGYVLGSTSRSAVMRWDVAPGGGSSDLTPPVFGAVGDTFRLFIGTGWGDRSLYALNPQTGATLWHFTAPPNNGFMGAPAAVDGLLFAATMGQSPEVYALDQETGAVIWRTPLIGTGSGASIAVTAGRVLVNTHAHELYSFNAFNGAFQWKAPTSPGAGSQGSSPAVYMDRVYVGSDNGIWAFDLATGALAWSHPLGGITGFSSPVIAAGATGGPLVLIGDSTGTITALNAATGTLAWSYPTGMSLANTTLAVAAGRVFAMRPGEAIALDVNTGALLWRRPMSLSLKSPAVAGYIVYYCTGPNVAGLDTATGIPVWIGAVPGAGVATGADMAIALEILVVPNLGRVYAFK